MFDQLSFTLEPGCGTHSHEILVEGRPHSRMGIRPKAWKPPPNVVCSLETLNTIAVPRINTSCSDLPRVTLLPSLLCWRAKLLDGF
jgi:hypothetical protein